MTTIIKYQSNTSKNGKPTFCQVLWHQQFKMMLTSSEWNDSKTVERKIGLTLTLFSNVKNLLSLTTIATSIGRQPKSKRRERKDLARRRQNGHLYKPKKFEIKERKNDFLVFFQIVKWRFSFSYVVIVMLRFASKWKCDVFFRIFAHCCVSISFCCE